MHHSAQNSPYDGITQQVQRVTDGVSPYLSRVLPAPPIQLCDFSGDIYTTERQKTQGAAPDHMRKQSRT